MNTLYVNVRDSKVKDITNNTDGVTNIHLGVKYIHGKDNVIFTIDSNGFVVVNRYRGKTKLYSYTFREDGNYMLTPLFVTTYKATTPEYRSVYNFLKKNYNENFHLEVDNSIAIPYQIVFKSWVDVSFNIKFDIKINDKLMDQESMNELKSCMLNMKDINLMELHIKIKGKSIYIDVAAIERLKKLPNLLVQQAW